jgi:hypothetical protein
LFSVLIFDTQIKWISNQSFYEIYHIETIKEFLIIAQQTPSEKIL